MNDRDDPVDEPAVSTPALRMFVELARSQSVPVRRRDLDEIHKAVLAARQARRRRIGAYATLAVAAVLAALVIVRLDRSGDAAPAGPQDLSISAGSNGHVAQDMHPGPAGVAGAPTLSGAAHVLADTEATPSPTVLAPWEVALAPGRYKVEVDEHPGEEALLLHAQGGTLELHHGSVLMIVGAAHTEVALRSGVGVWVAADGRREPLVASAEPPAAPDVSALARRAEALLVAGKRDAAIEQLGQLVTAYPAHPTARTALLDLAPLLAAAGRVDEARCAYRLYLARYPGTPQLADQVRKALARLGEGRGCDGLKPD